VDGTQNMEPLGFELRGGHALEETRCYLLDSHHEELFVGGGTTTETPNGPVFVVREIEQAPEEQITRDQWGLHWSPDLTRRWTATAERQGLGVVILHAHNHRGRVCLSSTDDRTCARLLTHFAELIPGQAHGYVVVGLEAVAGWFRYRGSRVPLRVLKTVGCPVRRWAEHPEHIAPAPDLMARQVGAIGDLGQAHVGSSTVGLVGVGGGGSIASDMLAHMGIGRLLLCDGDVLKAINLSRQTGAGPADIGRVKAEVAAERALAANPSVHIEVYAERFPQPMSYKAFRSADVIVSCVDSAEARTEINAFGRRFLIPIVDIGATIKRDGGRLAAIVGHVARLLPDRACMECEGLTSRLLRNEELAGRRVAYYDSEEPAGAPQVMSINGLLASMAVTEVLRLLAGVTADGESRHWRYDAMTGEVYVRGPVLTRCSACGWTGTGERGL
jgi:ThiF family